MDGVCVLFFFFVWKGMGSDPRQGEGEDLGGADDILQLLALLLGHGHVLGHEVLPVLDHVLALRVIFGRQGGEGHRKGKESTSARPINTTKHAADRKTHDTTKTSPKKHCIHSHERRKKSAPLQSGLGLCSRPFRTQKPRTRSRSGPLFSRRGASERGQKMRERKENAPAHPGSRIP